MGGRTSIGATITAVGLLALVAACGEASTPPPAPVTVVAVGPTAQAVTLSTGARIWGTALDLAVDDTAGDYRAACVTAFDRTYTEQALIGRTVVALRTLSVWQSAPAGYTPAEVRYAAQGQRTYIDGDDILCADDVPIQRLAACPQHIETAPASGSSPSSSSSSNTDVDVDIDREHHESRFCRRHRWC